MDTFKRFEPQTTLSIHPKNANKMPKWSFQQQQALKTPLVINLPMSDHYLVIRNGQLNYFTLPCVYITNLQNKIGILKRCFENLFFNVQSESLNQHKIAFNTTNSKANCYCHFLLYLPINHNLTVILIILSYYFEKY